MKYSAEIPAGIKNVFARYGFLIFSLGYLLLAFKLLPDYGLGFDSPKNFDEGWVNLNYLLTGQTSSHDQFSLAFQLHGAFFFMVADLLKRILSDGLGWLDPVTARHAFLPLLVFCFMNLYYAFLKKRTGAQSAFLACALLLTIPSFFGHTFNNIKDIPLFVFFSLSILCFYGWYDSGFKGLRCLYGVFLALGFTFLSKLYAVLVPIILAVWLGFLKLQPFHEAPQNPPDAGQLWTRRNLFHAIIGLMLVLVLLALFFMPGFYPVKEKMIFFEMKARAAKRLMQHGTQGWSFYPWIQAFYIMPALTLVMAVLGMIKTLLHKPLSPFSILMLTWLFTVMFVACTPLFPVYHGIRLFMVFLVPFCFFSAEGVIFAAKLLGKVPFVKKTWATGILGFVLIATQIAGIVRTHPYETAFFNCLAGGLKGAQEKRIPDAGDFWLTSYREAAGWINRHAPAYSSVWLPSIDAFYILRFYPLRSDLRFDFVRNIPLPGNSFLFISPGETCWANVAAEVRKNIEREASRMEKAHTITRQGGEILTICYKP